MKITISQSTQRELQKAIEQAHSSKEIRWYEKLIFIQTVSFYPSLEVAAEVFQSHRSTLYHWLSLFIAYGPWGLKRRGKSGRPAKLTKTQKRELSRLLHRGPAEAGYQRGGWTATLVQEVIQKHYGVNYQVKYIPELLKQLGFRHKKLSLVSHKANPEAQEQWKTELWPGLLEKARKEKAVVLFEDECTFRIWSQSEYTWAYRGKKPVAKVHMGSHRQEVMGAVNLRSGKFTYKIVKKRCSETFLDFLKYLKQVYPNRKVYLVCDNGPVHRGKVLQPWLEKHSAQLELVFLPSYSPQFNPIERLWKQLKQNHFHGVLFKTKSDFERTLQRALKHFQRFPTEVLTLMASWRKLDLAIRNQISSASLKAQEAISIAG